VITEMSSSFSYIQTG